VTPLRDGARSVVGSVCWLSIHTLAAWQAWPYCDSVASAGTSTLVVTPPGETPTAPGWADSEGRGGSSLVDVGGEADVDGFCSFDEQATTVSISSPVNKATRRRDLRMPPTLCNASAPGRAPAPHGPAGYPEGRDSSAHRESRPIHVQSDAEQGRRRYGTGVPDRVVPT